jgi:hypothetical protein
LAVVNAVKDEEAETFSQAARNAAIKLNDSEIAFLVVQHKS